MSRDRISRHTSFGSYDFATKSDSSKPTLRRIGRMYTSPSLDRLNAFDRSSSSTLTRHKSIFDVSNSYDPTSPLGISSPIVHRNANFQKMRTNVWRQSESKKMFTTSRTASTPRRDLFSTDSYMGLSSSPYSSTTSRYPDPIAVLDRRDLLFSQLKEASSPKVGRRNQLTNRSNHLSGYRHANHWPTMTSVPENGWRARLRERPVLSKMSVRSKPSLTNSGLSSRTSSTSSNKMDDSVNEGTDGSSGIYRNRYIIKFREHNLGQTPSQRRSSITWDLPKTYSSVKASEESPISEDTESEPQPDIKDAESESQTQQKESASEEINELNDSELNNYEIKNKQKIEGLVSDQEITTKSISNEFQPECNASQVVIDILPIHTAVMPEPSGTDIQTSSLLQKAATLKSKPIDKQNVQKVSDSKAPKKKKVKKKDPKDTKDTKETKDIKETKDVKEIKDKDLKVKIKEEPKQLDNVVIKEDTENVSTKVGIKVSKDINENILNELDLNLNQNKQNLDLTPKRIKFRKYTFDDFILLKVLGRGSFGKVLLAELKEHNVYFAIKCLKKHSVIEDDDIESIMIERKVLAYGTNHPFICKLFCTFQSESYLCFAMEWCCGGDLMFHVQKEGKFDEDKARFYASEILCAVKFMHNKGIIYRDLKLDNIMVDSKGHLRLVDFGMCQGRIYRDDLLPSNFCGTPEYMAPEIIKGVKYNQSVDFWSFGVLVYEMVVGTSPFHGTDEDELLWNVCHEEVKYPLFLSQDIKSLLILLLNKCPEQRLGMPTCVAGDIFSQPFFKSIDWVKVEKCQMKPPFVPELSSPSDVSYFESYFTKEEAKLTPVPEEITLSMDQTVFKGFSYTNHNMTD